MEYKFQEVDVTGSRLKGTFLKVAGEIPLKHHGIIIGKNVKDNNIYVAENRKGLGLELATVEDFRKRYFENGDVVLLQNDGNKTNFEVAQNALDEVFSDSKKEYNLIFNNCESFANRAMYNHSLSGQIVLSALGGLVLISVGKWIVKQWKSDQVIT
ncbi:MAG: hypothetical protein KAQ94_02810 [Arcobacteraceae bacterium]|nr:hypothetical protein [Arcobacteraceae bacterium]